jgi:hypothetical protein
VAPPLGVDLIDNTLQIITSMQQKRRELEAENEDLRVQMGKITAARDNMDYEKAKYMEGAVWFGRRITAEIEKLCHQVETMVREYFYRENNSGGSYKAQSLAGSSASMMGGGAGTRNGCATSNERNVAWLTEAIKKASMDLYETAITMLESSIHNMDEAQVNIVSQSATSVHNVTNNNNNLGYNGSSGFPKVENLLIKPNH